MLNQIIILDNEPFSVIRKKNFFVDEFLKKGYSVEHYSLINYLSISGTTKYHNTETSGIAFFLENKKQIITLIKSINTSNTFIFVELHFNKSTYFIFKHLYDIKAIWGRLSYYTNPAVNIYKVKRVLPSEKLKRYKNFNYIKFAIFAKLFNNRINKITQAHVTFKTGTSNFNFPKSKKLININYFDLEEFKLQKNNPAIINSEYIVFNDIFLPFHPDLQRINRGIEFINPARYFEELNLFFDQIEAQYELEVIIAAHPKAQYKNEFGNRKIIYGQTANLIINCKLLITHLSISTDYALFSQKPVLFFYTPSLSESLPLQYLINCMKIYSEKINTFIVNSESINELPDFINLKIDVDAYNNIISKYFGDINSNKNNFEIVHSELTSLFNSKN